MFCLLQNLTLKVQIWQTLSSHKQFDILFYGQLQMFSYLTAQSTFFHQGNDLFEDSDPFMKDVAAKVSK